MTKRLIIDLAKCDRCESCGVSCSFYDCRPDNAKGQVGPMLSLREKATFALVCRRCEQASCILACPFDALEKTGDGIVKRHNLRCVSCKSCAIACPFGTIYPELLPFYSMSYESSCKSCLSGHVGGRHAGESLTCVATCKENALEYREIQPGETGIHVVDDYLAARTRAWVRRETNMEASP